MRPYNKAYTLCRMQLYLYHSGVLWVCSNISGLVEQVYTMISILVMSVFVVVPGFFWQGIESHFSG